MVDRPQQPYSSAVFVLEYAAQYRKKKVSTTCARAPSSCRAVARRRLLEMPARRVVAEHSGTYTRRAPGTPWASATCNIAPATATICASGSTDRACGGSKASSGGQNLGAGIGTQELDFHRKTMARGSTVRKHRLR